MKLAFLIGFGVLSLTTLAMGQNSGPASQPQAAPLPVHFFRSLKGGHKQTVVVYGTSLTASAAWPTAFKTYLDQAFPGQITFHNTAMNGQTSRWGLENLQSHVLAHNPDLVFIEFSANDAATKNHISPEQSEKNLDQMISQLKQQNPQVDVVLMTMNLAWDSPTEPNGKKFATDRPNLVGYYDLYRRYAAAHAIPLIDHTAAWSKLKSSDPKAYEVAVPDGIHPSPDASLAVTWPAIKAILEKARAAE